MAGTDHDKEIRDRKLELAALNKAMHGGETLADLTERVARARKELEIAQLETQITEAKARLANEASRLEAEATALKNPQASAPSLAPQFQSQRSARVDPARSVYVGNLPAAVAEARVRARFEQNARRVTQVYIAKVRGATTYGFVEFASPSDVQNAIATVDNTMLDGCTLEVRQMNNRGNSASQSAAQAQAPQQQATTASQPAPAAPKVPTP